MNHHVNAVKLPNKIHGLFIDVPNAPVLGVELNFRAGDYLSPPNKWEVAHVLEHMVLGANKDYRKAREFHAIFQQNGAYMNATTSTYNLNYIVECADFEWQRILKLLKKSITTPLLKQEEFEAEMGNVREELSGDLNQHFRQLIILSREKLGLVGLNDAERIVQMGNIALPDVGYHYRKTHSTDNMRFVVAGNLRGRKAEITRMFSRFGLPRGKRYELPEETPARFEEVYYIDRPELTNLLFIWHILAQQQLTQLQEDAVNLASVILTNTLHSKILGEARERGLVYGMTSQYSRTIDLSDWWFGAEVLPENAEGLFDIIVRELQQVLNGKLPIKDIEAAKQYSLGRYQRGIQTVRGLINGYSTNFFFDGSVEDYYKVPDRLNAITKHDIIETIRLLFKNELWGLTVMGRNQQILAQRLQKKLSSLW